MINTAVELIVQNKEKETGEAQFENMKKITGKIKISI